MVIAMNDPLPLAALGQRICILGPSNNGKSTLAAAIGRKLGIPAIHLDQMFHLPNTNWVQRPKEEFYALHDAAVDSDAWVMDGNYSSAMPKRFARATGAILLNAPRLANLSRYFHRTLFEKQRHGALDGNADSVKWNMIHWILFVQPANHGKYDAMLAEAGLPVVRANSMAEVKTLYRAWGLERI